MALNRKVGYAYLQDHFNTGAFEPVRPAKVYPVQKIVQMADCVQVPEHAAPLVGATALDHLLFALKHEELDLQGAVLALKQIDAEPLVAQFSNAPGSTYLQQACYLWELANDRVLQAPQATGATKPLFNPKQFITGPSNKCTRWRVDFNGIGTPQYSPSIRRTPEIEALLAEDTLEQARTFIQTMDKDMLDRTMSWAYLSETEGSFAIERESPSPSRAEAFVKLLSRAYEDVALTEDYLVQLQNLTVRSALDQAVQFRVQQNWLRRDTSVTYVPPTPTDLIPVMDGLLTLANNPPDGVPPLVLGALVSFAFVFAHPFMDGNGRLSRFLFHKIACRDAQFPHGLVLPISIAMARHEGEYLSALKSFSSPARDLWTVARVDEQTFDCTFNGDAAIYRYWDATQCVHFGLWMAKEALQHDLYAEVQFLGKFDRLYRKLNSTIDLNNNLLNLLTRLLIQNEGTLSAKKRKMFIGDGVPAALLTEAEALAQELLGGDAPD